MTILLAAASTVSDQDSGVNPLFFVLGAVALILVSTLGPLSRLHERRERLKREARGESTTPQD